MLKKRKKLTIRLLLALLLSTMCTSLMPTTTVFATETAQSDFTFDARTGTITKYIGQ